MAKRKVLLVDDEIDFINLMVKVIESWGYEVLTAANGDEALEKFKNQNPKALILDYVMPDITGIELLRKIREIDRHVPAIMFTARPTVKAIEGSKELNIAAFIPKVSPYINTHEDLRMALDLVSKGI
ncbi:MAG: response regulator [Candidatus Omnitrophica bacterium]|nr:response regulator [Candidatus Omnitrophota bacterium]